jgi:hypothetical protein
MRIDEVLNKSGYLTEDLDQILQAHRLNEWSDPIPCEEFIALLEATTMAQTTQNKVVVQTCRLFDQSLDAKKRAYPQVGQKLAEFLSVKQHNPMQQFGGSDTTFIATGPLGRAVPKLRHAHLTQDLSVFYTMGGQNPTLINLYGIFSHKDSGTGNAPNAKQQKNLGKQLANQTFN